MGAEAKPQMPGRVDWVDYAKGFCIVMVVMMHSTLGLEKAVGETSWLGAVVEFARPFRMPDFFLISGLFLSRVIERDWRDYLDRKVLHFAYFYALWVTIQFVFRAPGIAAEAGVAGVIKEFLLAFIEPFGTLWFIYLLPIFFVVTKLTRRVPPVLIFVAGALLESLKIHTGWTVIDEFAARFVYFFAGYWFAAYVFALARNVQAHPRFASAGLALWAIVNGGLVAAGISTMPGVSLFLGGIGALAVVSFSALLAKARFFDPLRYAGENSLVVYLAFFLPMAATRTALLKTDLIPDLGTAALIITAVAAVTPLLFYRLVRGTWASFLFHRPNAFRLEGRREAYLQPAE
ncbi:MAG TPA: acyltransferase family protein [Xanthobacteraceae bacterium]|nr:acyltransferase family protein [Xanthobacteraceae bacterium]